MTRLKKMSGREESDNALEQTSNGPVFQPLVDIYETGDSLVVLADMPGVGPDDISIDLENDILRLRATPKYADNTDNAIIGEYDTGAFLRQFHLTEAIDREKIKAEMKNGELKLILPKAAKAMPRRIEVRAG